MGRDGAAPLGARAGSPLGDLEGDVELHGHVEDRRPFVWREPRGDEQRERLGGDQPLGDDSIHRGFLLAYQAVGGEARVADASLDGHEVVREHRSQFPPSERDRQVDDAPIALSPPQALDSVR